MNEKTSPSSLYDHYTYTFFILPEWVILVGYTYLGYTYQFKDWFAGFALTNRKFTFHNFLRCGLFLLLLSLLLLSLFASIAVAFPFVLFRLRLTSFRYYFFRQNQSENQIEISNFCVYVCVRLCRIFTVCIHNTQTVWLMVGTTLCVLYRYRPNKIHTHTAIHTETALLFCFGFRRQTPTEIYWYIYISVRSDE